MAKHQNVTMKDVAQLAGVSQATVSYVLNDTIPVTEEVRNRVLDSVKQLGYTTNIYARGLKTHRSNVIGLLLPDICVDFFAEIARAIELRLQREGYVLMLGNTSYDRNNEDCYISSFMEFNVAGIIISYGLSDPQIYNRLISRGIPFITLDERVQISGHSIPSIEIDNVLGGLLAVTHLIKIGSKRISFASEPLGNNALSRRFDGYKQGLAEHGYELDESICYIENRHYDKFEMGRNIGAKIILDKSIDAVFASNDQIACGIISRFRDYNINVPEEVAIVGYDNVLWSNLIIPSLTTISQPNIVMAQLGAKNILRLINQSELSEIESNILLEPSLIVRQSTMRVNR